MGNGFRWVSKEVFYIKPLQRKGCWGERSLPHATEWSLTCMLQILYRTGEPLQRDMELQLRSWKMAPPSQVLEHWLQADQADHRAGSSSSCTEHYLSGCVGTHSITCFPWYQIKTGWKLGLHNGPLTQSKRNLLCLQKIRFFKSRLRVGQHFVVRSSRYAKKLCPVSTPQPISIVLMAKWSLYCVRVYSTVNLNFFRSYPRTSPKPRFSNVNTKTLRKKNILFPKMNLFLNISKQILVHLV